MSAHPDKELLSAHADASAPASERAMLDGHLASCAACRKEFAELKALSKLVGGLPQAELPTGFMARLERRRREGETSPALFAMPALSPLRFAGFAATGLLVCLVFFREVRYRFAPQMLGAAAVDEGDTGIQSELSVSRADEADDAALEAARLAAVQRGAWKGLSEQAGGAAGAASAAGEAAPTAQTSDKERSELLAVAKSVSGSAFLQAPLTRAKLKAGGAPLGSGASSTNEEMQARLEEEKRRMGIREIVPPNAPAPAADGLPDRPLSKDEAMDYMRSMTRHLATLNQNANNKKRPTVELGPGATPRILGAADGSQPVAPESKAAAKADAGSLAMVRGAQGARVDEPASFEPPPMRRPPYAEPGLRRAAAPAAAAGALAPAAPGPAVPAKTLTPRGFWAGSEGGPGTDGGAVIMKAEDWADLWKRVGRVEALPPVDFETEMAVAVFAARDAENRRSVEIVSLSEEAGSLVIRFRVRDEGVKAPSTPYHVVVAPKSVLPYEFVQVR